MLQSRAVSCKSALQRKKPSTHARQKKSRAHKSCSEWQLTEQSVKPGAGNVNLLLLAFACHPGEGVLREALNI